MNIIELSPGRYSDALRSGDFAYPGLARPFFPLDRVKYDKIRKDARKLDLEQVRKRLSGDMFREVRGAVGLTLAHAQNIFPAYSFLLPEFLNEEWLASVDWHKGFHRDHVLHQPMCAYVADVLLRKISGLGPLNAPMLDNALDVFLFGPGCGYLRDHAAELGAGAILDTLRDKRPKLLCGLIRETLFLAAMFHDVGYPWQFAVNLEDALGPLALDAAPPLDAARVLELYGDRLLLAPFRGYRLTTPAAPSTWATTLKELIALSLRKTHGLPGAINFLHLNDVLRVYPDGGLPLRRFALEWAAQAIVLHDLPKIYAKVDKGVLKVANPHLRLSFTRDPVSFVLTLTDVIQDFGRPDASFQAKKNSVDVRYRHRCKQAKLIWDDTARVLTIVYGYENHADFVVNKEKFTKENELLFFDPDRGYLDYSHLGIERIRLDAEMV